CKFCQTSVEDLAMHLIEKHPKLYCSECNRVFSSAFSRNRHLKTNVSPTVPTEHQAKETTENQLICNIDIYKSQIDGTISVKAIKEANKAQISCLAEVLYNIHKIALNRSERNVIVKFLPIIRYIGNYCSSRSVFKMKHTSRVQPFVAVTQKEANAIEMERRFDDIIRRKDLNPHHKMRLYQDRLARLVNFRK
ncbi:hypothetical protein PENTCL1PPCAC_25765, partial [Pristionchus entomophagus]